MLVTDYQGPLLSVFSSLIDRHERTARCAVQWARAGRLALDLSTNRRTSQRRCRICPRRFRLRSDARSAHATLGRGAVLGAAGHQHIHQGSACGGCFGGNRKVALGAVPYKPLGVAARQQSGFSY